MPPRSDHFQTYALPGLLALLAILSGCASRLPEARAPVAAVEEQPEPLPKGMKPLTVEQEEMIQQ